MYIITIQTQIIKVYFFMEKWVFNVFLKIIDEQNQLPITFWSYFVYIQ